jgi:hypothetical protein
VGGGIANVRYDRTGIDIDKNDKAIVDQGRVISHNIIFVRGGIANNCDGIDIDTIDRASTSIRMTRPLSIREE